MNRDRLAWAAVGTACALDGVTTSLGLSVGMTEANPIAAHLIGSLGLLPALLLLKGGAIILAVLGWVALPDGNGWVAPAGLAVPWAIAAVGNAVGLALLLTG